MFKRPKPRMLMLSFSILSVLILLLSACGAPSQPQGNGNGTPQKGGVWQDDLFEEPNSLVPNASSETFSDMVDQAIWAPLFYTDPTGVIQPGLATVVPTVANGGASKDLKTWTFHLRPNLKWTDGQPEDARDVDFTWRLWTNPKFPAAGTNGINLITATDISSDNLTITFHLKAPFVEFVGSWLDGLTAPMPAHVYSKIAPDKITTSKGNLNPQVTSGPFKMLESAPGSHYTVTRSSTYYQAAQGLPYLDKVVFRVTADQDTVLKDLQAGTINSSWFLDVTKTAAYKQLKSTYTLGSNPKSPNFEAMYFNFNNKILGQNVDVRKAMAMAIDHQSLIQVARRGQAVALCTDHAAAYKVGYEPNAPCPKFDAAAANALLDSDGWVKGADGVRSKNGQRLEFSYSTTANNPWRAEDELILQSNMQAIGIKLDTQNYPASTFFGPFLNSGTPGIGHYDIAEYETSPAVQGDDSSIAACSQIPPAGSNFMFYCNHDLDNLYSQELATGDPTTRQAIFDKIHQIYLTQFPFITLYSPVDISMVKVTGHNYQPAPQGASETSTIWNWWCTNGQC